MALYSKFLLYGYKNTADWAIEQLNVSKVTASELYIWAENHWSLQDLVQVKKDQFEIPRTH